MLMHRLRLPSFAMRRMRMAVAFLRDPTHVENRHKRAFHSHELPAPQSFSVDNGRCTIQYIDIRPSVVTHTKKTIVCLHGAPGTYKDFRHLYPVIPQDVRVIGMTLPGCNGCRLQNHRDLLHYASAHKSADIVYNALQQLCDPSDEHLFIVGHSFGGHTAINLAALNQTHQRFQLRGLVLLASAGLWPHKAMAPRLNQVALKMLQFKLEWVASQAPHIIKAFYTNLLRFPVYPPASHYAAGLVRLATTDFDAVATQMHQLQHLPTFLSWANDDEYIEPEIFKATSQVVGAGPRLVFPIGGHNIQKSHAKQLAAEMMQWMDQAVQKS